MAKREFAHPNEMQKHVGQEIGVSDWVEVTQERINQFAEATGDHQWIHLDVERAKRESPYGATIAHGFLTLSMLSQLMQNAFKFKSPIKMGINYGLNRVRFPSAVPAGSEVRARLTLAALEEILGGLQATWSAVVERRGSDKPCCVADWLVRYYV